MIAIFTATRDLCPYKNLTFGEKISITEPLEYFVIEFGPMSDETGSSRIEVLADEAHFFEVGNGVFKHVSPIFNSLLTFWLNIFISRTMGTMSRLRTGRSRSCGVPC